MLSVGTRSVLFGVHQFFWHPITVARAWRSLYGRWPNWWQWVAIVVHDLGYFGKPNMDGPEGETHPEFGARLARGIVRLFGDAATAQAAHDLALYHSRFYAARDGAEPSALCWADKLSVLFDPPWFYLCRGRASGEVKEFVRRAPDFLRNDKAWLSWYRAEALCVCLMRKKAKSRYV